MDRASLLDEHHAVARRFHLAEEMRVQEHGRPPGSQLAQQIADQEPPERIEARRRLVEKHEIGDR